MALNYEGLAKVIECYIAGNVNGFDKASAAELQARLKSLIRKTHKKVAHRGVWVEPSPVC